MNKKIKLVIFGLGEFGELAHFYFTNDSKYEVVAFCVDKAFKNTEEFLGLPVVEFENVEIIYPPSEYDFFVAIGYSKLNKNRIEKYTISKRKGYYLANYVSSKNSVWNDFKVGENTFIMENNTIMPFTKVGNNVLIWVGNIIAHHMVIEDHVTITSHCAIGGNVIIKSKAFIGLNATIRDGVIVGEQTIVAASSNLVKNADSGEVYMGNPAKSIGKKSYEIDL
ncbi:hypothetical protein AWE51_23080 [Aquimarina aggregata]|uniref:PglD N-terminal domain-containing protein n=1 Tax=Aquimarina aggregata TaxID=1642818 RepID=A0A163BDU1_9FLAO|nr:acetyltransferase [Aquimarina aggregata]KZS41291.1 hypothetical protein AWE51_23080 [Aquimarina aggregata]